MITWNFKNEILMMEAIKPKSQADFLFFVNMIQVITKKGFASQVKPTPPANIASQPTSKTSNEVLQSLFVQKQILKSEKTNSKIPKINITVFNFDFSSTNICSSSENGMIGTIYYLLSGGPKRAAYAED
jgi:hypothetical protein